MFKADHIRLEEEGSMSDGGKYQAKRLERQTNIKVDSARRAQRLKPNDLCKHAHPRPPPHITQPPSSRQLDILSL